MELIGESGKAEVPGVQGENTAGGEGLKGISNEGRGISGWSLASYGVSGDSKKSAGMRGTSVDGRGVEGWTTNSEGVVGISTNGTGVWGQTEGSGIGVAGSSKSGPGMRGTSESASGIFGQSKTGRGIEGWSETNYGVSGDSQKSAGVRGTSVKGRGVEGWSTNSEGVVGISTNSTGVWGQTEGAGTGVAGTSKSGVGVHGKGGRLAGLFEGDVHVTGDINCPNADCAEDFDVSGADKVEPGTVMVLGNEGALSQSQQAYDKRVAGVISGAGDYKPGIVLDKRQSQGNRQPVSLMGKVFCKVDAQFGAIEVGDLLTTSPTPGHAMKTSDPLKAFGAVIGKALRPLTEGQGLIPILIALQ